MPGNGGTAQFEHRWYRLRLIPIGRPFFAGTARSCRGAHRRHLLVPKVPQVPRPDLLPAAAEIIPGLAPGGASRQEVSRDLDQAPTSRVEMSRFVRFLAPAATLCSWIRRFAPAASSTWNQRPSARVRTRPMAWIVGAVNADASTAAIGELGSERKQRSKDERSDYRRRRQR